MEPHNRDSPYPSLTAGAEYGFQTIYPTLGLLISLNSRVEQN